MPRQQGSGVVNNFIQGLVTEATPLKFPENASTDCFDVVFDETGRVTHRLGWDIEEDFSLLSTTKESGAAVTEFLWKAVTGDGDVNFLVQQKGNILYFYDVSSDTDVSSNNTTQTIDLDDFAVVGSSRDPATEICQYASGTGRLVVVNPACDPILVEFIDGTLIGSDIEVKIRDFTGLQDGLSDNERLTSSVADLITNNPAHYYNLLNQSWFIADALSQWDAARTDVPDNRDYVGLYRASETDAFDNARVLANTPGNRRAPRGHFVLNAWCPDHTQAMADEGFTATITSGETTIGLSSFDTIGSFDTRTDAAFDGDTTQGASVSAAETGTFATEGWIGKTFPFPTRIIQVVVHGSNDAGFISAANPSMTITLYGKQGSAPASATDGTLLGTVSFTDTADESAGRTAVSSDQDTFWDHFWVRVQNISGTGTGMFVTEIVLSTFDSDEGLFCTAERPSCVEFFAGRVWYAGTDFSKLATNIYFSQIIEERVQFGRCYQMNDPASEDFTDLLADDGGVIVIPELANVLRLFAVQNGLFVLATNGVWLITGGSQSGFLANDFTVRKISEIGITAPLSVISARGMPVWWGDDGLYTAMVSPENNSFNVTSVTDQRIKSFILSIPEENIPYVKGSFNTKEALMYWLYNSEENADPWIYNRVLVSNGLSGAFYPWTISDSVPEIRGVTYVQTTDGRSETKFTTTIPIDASNEYLTFSANRNINYRDWGFYADTQGEPSAVQDYEGYFITGYYLDGQALRFGQKNYIIVYSDNDPCGSCFVQGVFDFTTSDFSHRWGTPQQVVNPGIDHSSVNYKRLKIRGKGRACQLKFTGESGKPFSVIGWARWVTVNAAP